MVKTTNMEQRQDRKCENASYKVRQALHSTRWSPILTHIAGGGFVKYIHHWVNISIGHIVFFRFMMNHLFWRIYSISKFNETWRFWSTFSITSLLWHSSRVWQSHLRIHWSGTHWHNFSSCTQTGKWGDMHGRAYSSNWASHHRPASYQEGISAT